MIWWEMEDRKTTSFRAKVSVFPGSLVRQISQGRVAKKKPPVSKSMA